LARSDDQSLRRSLQQNLSALAGDTVQVVASQAYPAPSVSFNFSGGAVLRADFWRLIKDGRHRRSSFDHEQKYGLPAPIDAVRDLRNELQDKQILKAGPDEETGDLLFEFADRLKLQVLNFTGYEVWEISFPDGTGEYSNYVWRLPRRH